MNENKSFDDYVKEANAFDTYIANALLSLSGLMTTETVCRNTKNVAKINRFKQWLYALQNSTIEVTATTNE